MCQAVSIANPNCTTMAAMPAVKVLHDNFGLKRLLASRTSCCWRGAYGVLQLVNEAKAALDQGADQLRFDGSAIAFPEPTKIVKTIAFQRCAVYWGDCG